MKQANLLVSVIILLDDDNSFLEDTICSIKAQNYPLLEIIMIDRSLQRSFTELAQHFKDIRYYHQPDCNQAFGRNFGIQLARGEAIAFLDSGDMWADNQLAEQIEYLEANPEAEIVQGLIQNVTETSKYPDLIEKFALVYDFINTGSLVFRRSVFQRVGVFDEALDAGEEIDWFFRASTMDIIKAKLDNVTLFQRHNNHQEATESLQFSLLKVVKKYISKRKEDTELQSRIQKSSAKSYIGNPRNEIETGIRAFTIISDDCWSYGPYEELGLRYSTPFIGIRIEAPSYLELLKDLRGYVESPLIFTNISKDANINSWRDKEKLSFPMALLKNKVELFFIHETDEEVCRRKWEKRVKRISWDNLFIKFRENSWNFRQEYLTEFDQLPYEYKIAFTLKEYPEFQWAVPAPDYLKNLDAGGSPYDPTKQYFDATSWVKKIYGSNALAYKVKLQPQDRELQLN
jgi:uncharacterized protein (DUF1919 family)/septum formation topological specificity factor MinE